MARRPRQSAAASASAGPSGSAQAAGQPAVTPPAAAAAAAAAPAPAPRRRGVVGPTSALTSFLADLGVQAPRINFAGTVIPAVTAPGAHSSTNQPDPTTDTSEVVTGRLTQSGPTEVGDGDPEYDDDDVSRKGRRGRGRVGSDADSDAIDEDDIPPPPKRARTSTAGRSGATSVARSGTNTPAEMVLRAIGEFMLCSECEKQFTVTAYTKPHPTQPGYLCFDCTTSLGIDPFSKNKKTRAPVKAKGKREERGKITHYEERRGAMSLGDMCIKLIGKYIEDVEALGDIGALNMEKVCQIICKSRRLTPETATLFYSGDRTELRMYDCTKLVPDSYITLAGLCPNLETLHLNLCGRIDTQSLIKWGTSFKSLKNIELDGPFLVRVDGWKKFFQGIGGKLEGFLINQQPRFDLPCLEAMVKYCPNIQRLRLSEFGLLNDDWLPVISKLKNLTYLDLARPGKDSLQDDAVIEMLSKIGKNLVHLDLSRHIDLSDDVLVNGVAKFCPNLKSLRMEDVSGNPDLNKPDSIGLTDEGVVEFFKTWNGNDGCTDLDFHGCHSLQGDALNALIEHSGKSLRSLNISGWKDVSIDALKGLAESCKKLEELDVGWCRYMTDFVIKDILEGCPEIKVIKVWGCNNLTDAVPRRKGCRVVGIETHAI